MSAERMISRAGQAARSMQTEGRTDGGRMRGWRMDVVRAPRFRASERTLFSRRSSGRRAGRRARECLVRRGTALKGRLHCTEPEKMVWVKFLSAVT